MSSSKMFVCNIFGDVLEGERDHPRAHTDDQCYQPSGLRQTFQGPKPTLPASENFDLTGSTSPRDFDFEVKVEPPDTFDPTHGRPFDDDSADDFQVKEEAIMLEDVKIEVSSSSEGIPTSEDESVTVYHGASKKSSKNRERQPRLIRESQEHACEKCAFISQSKGGLTQHIKRLHQPLQQHACEECAFKSKTKRGLTQHIRKFHQMSQEHACQKCAFISQSKSFLTLHIRKFHRKVKCTICDYRTDRVESMKKHLLIHKRKKEYICHSCPYKCNSRMLIKRHLLNIHTEVKCTICDYRTDRVESMKKHLLIHKSKKKYVCYSCKFTCTGRINLKRHIAKIHREVKCTICDYRTDRVQSMKKHLLIHEKSQEHACEKCDFKSKYRRGLTQHIRKFHRRPALLDCEFCGSKFRTDNALSLHLKTHNGKKKYVCYSCKLTCTRRNSLKRHIAKIHTEVKCTLCDYRADRIESMKKHLLIHERKKEYMCHAGPYKCNSRELIKRHLLNIHTGVLPCDFCGKKFVTDEALSFHLRTHNGEKKYECYHCKYTCNRRNMIKTHFAKKHPGVLPCEFCGKKFVTDEALSLHLRIHNGEKKYECYHCKYTCNRRNMIKTHIDEKHPAMKCPCCDHRTNCKGSMRKHFLLLHERETPFACNSCSFKTHLQQRLHEHTKSHSEGAVNECHYCQSYLPNRLRLKNHIFNKHLKESPYACKMCDKRFKRRDYLIGHMNLHRGEKPFACNSCSFKTHLQQRLHKHIERKHSGERWYECDRCIYKTHVKDYLQRHRRATHMESLSCDVCGLSTTSTFRMKAHMVAHSFMEFYPDLEQPFHCILCNFKTHSMDRVGNHVSKHKAKFREKEQTYLCQVCGSPSTSKASWKRHLRIHTEEKPYACHFCDYKGRYGENLKKHIRSHLGLKPYACKECDYKCRGPGDLNRHMTIHTGEKKFACEFCGYRAARRETYRKHVMTHTGGKPHACNICSYKGAASSDLKRHMMNHTGDKTFKCEACSFKTVTRATFEKHIVKHKGMKKYICFTCKEIRYGRERFKKHLNSHSGDKEYVCSVCRYKCSRRSEIKFHFECANKEGSHWPVLSKYQLLSKCKTD